MYGEVVTASTDTASSRRSPTSRRRRVAGHRADGRRPPRAGGDVQGHLRGGDRPLVPGEPARPATAPTAPCSTPWNVPRAQVYRRANDIADDLGTAVNVVQMGSATAVRARHRRALHARLRDRRAPALRRVPRERVGEDVVAGSAPGADRPHASACPRRSSSSSARSTGSNRTTVTCRTSSSRSKRDAHLLQTRTGKRTAAAALRVAAEMVDEGLISREEAVARSTPPSSTSCCTP